MIKSILIASISIIIGSVFGIYCSYPLSSKFMEIRLFEIIQLFLTLALGGFVAFFFSKRLNNWGKRSEIVYKLLSDILEKYKYEFEKVIKFVEDPTSIPTTEVTLFFKEVSSNIATLEKYADKFKININNIDHIRKTHDKINELIVKDTWGSSPSGMTYSKDDKSNLKKEHSAIKGFIEDFIFDLYK